MFLFSSPGGGISSGVMKGVQSEFSELLGEQASVEEYAEWIKELVDKFVVKVTGVVVMVTGVVVVVTGVVVIEKGVVVMATGVFVMVAGVVFMVAGVFSC